MGRTGAYYIPSLPGIPGVLTDAQHGARTLAGAHVSADITNAWRRIAQSILAAPAASIDFQGIPATFEELMLTLIGNQDGVGSSNCSLRVNNDAGLTYHTQELRGVAAVASATESAAQSELLVGLLGNAAGHVSALRIYIPGYAGATFQKVIFSVSARKTSDLAGGFTLNMRGGFWASAAAIDRLTLFSNDGSFRVGTRATLYGIAA